MWRRAAHRAAWGFDADLGPGVRGRCNRHSHLFDDIEYATEEAAAYTDPH